MKGQIAQNLVPRSLRAKTIIWFLIPTAAILIAVAVLTFRASQQVTQALVLGRNQDRTQLLANQLGQEVRGYAERLDALTSTPDLYALSSAALQAAWRDANWYSFDSGVLVLDRSGRVITTVPDRLPLVSQNWADVASPAPEKDSDTIISNILPDAMPGTRVIALVRPVWASRTDQQGTVVGLFRIERGATRSSAFYRSVWNLYIGRKEIAFLVDGNGQVIFHPDTFLIGEEWSDHPAVRAALEGQHGAIVTRNQAQDQVVAGIAPVPGTPWTLITEEKWTDLLRPSQAYSHGMLALLAVGVIVPIIAVAFGVRRITEPIVRLTDASRAIAQGSFHPIEVHTGDEIETLARQFNSMARQVISSRAMLEQRVADRTRELAALNAVSDVISRSLDLQTVLAAALQKTLEVMHLEAGAAFRLEPDQQTLALIAHQGLSHVFVRRVDHLPLHMSAAAKAVAAHRPMTQRLSDYPEGELKAAIEAEGLQLVISVPLIAKGDILGVINLATRTERECTDQELALLASVAHQVGMAMENARLYEQAEEMAAAAERNRLARELHDAISQTLFSASLIADVLPRLWERNPTVARQRLEALSQLTRGAMAEMRTLLLELRPSALLEAELPDLLRQLGNAVAGRAQIAMHVEAEPVPDLPPDVKIGLYRIAQEALNNVVKHAQAGNVRLSLRYAIPTGEETQDLCVKLAILDDGCGFDSGNTPAVHFGLRNMAERAEAIGAALRIQSRPGQGTSVRVEWRGTNERTEADSRDAGRRSPDGS